MTREAHRDKALSKFSVGVVEAWQSLEHDSWKESLFWMSIISAKNVQKHSSSYARNCVL
jgi:hypothetical protein